MTVHVDIKLGNIARKVSKAKKFGNYMLTQQIAKDSNYYAPVDQGYLKNSALYSGVNPKTGNKAGPVKITHGHSGTIRWDVPYARRQYYGDAFHFSHDVNPHARARWFDAAKAEHGKEWADVAQKAVNDYLKRT